MNSRDRIPVCPHGTKNKLDFFLVAFCDFLDQMVNVEIPYSSGYRCPECNEKAGGSKNSAHLRGKAVDIKPIDSKQRYDIISLAIMKGIQRIGIARDHIHLDIDESLSQGVIWIE